MESTWTRQQLQKESPRDRKLLTDIRPYINVCNTQIIKETWHLDRRVSGAGPLRHFYSAPDAMRMIDLDDKVGRARSTKRGEHQYIQDACGNPPKR
jgi:hypothetical protein